MKLTWLKDVVGEVYTEEMDEAACQAIGKHFVSKADFNAKIQALQEKETEIATLQASAQAAQGLQTQLAELQAKYAKDTGELKLGRELDKALMGAKARNPEMLRRALDLSKVTLQEDGTLSGLSEQLEALKQSDGYLFGDDAPAGGGSRGNSGGSHGGGLKSYTREQLAAMTPAEINQNWADVAAALNQKG